jgi:nitrogen fixation/metabolism regulation signal transduction histidine kinase
VFITLRIARPIKEMTEVANEITRGDLNRAIGVKSNDEIGILARTFNVMTAKLKETLDNLVKSEEKYRGIFESAIEGLFQTSLDGVIYNANPAMARILGYESPEELMTTVKNTKKQLYVNPEEREKLVEIVKKQGSL